jgi:hypothetical protein
MMMNKKWLNIFLLFFLLSFHNGTIASDNEIKNEFIKVVNKAENSQVIQICQDGKALVPIVISPNASDEIKKTAETLASILKKISGATFLIETQDQPKGITLGTLKQFPDKTLNADMAIKDVYDGLEAYAILSDNGSIRLLGNTDLGVSHAMFHFLESLGYRYYFMSPKWEIIPDKKNLNCTLNEIRRPWMLSRSFSFTRMSMKFEKEDPYQREVFTKWKKANQVGESINVRAAHAWNQIPIAFRAKGYPYKQIFKDHPEYFALVKGKRKPDQFCVSNKDLQALVIDYANKYFEYYPTETMVSMETADNMDCCTCEECIRLGAIGNQPFYLANIVAKELQKTHPGKLVGLLAYSWHSEPPPFKLEPNILVQLTDGFNSSKYSFDELLVQWKKTGVRLGVYEYWSYWQMDYCLMPGRGPHNALDDLKPHMKKLYDSGIRTHTAESANSWGVHGLGYLVGHQLMWNPDADVDAFKKDFYQNAFGPSASVMEKYYECLNLSNNPFKVIAMLRECSEYLQEAVKLAKNNPQVLARLDELRANMVYNYIGSNYNLEKDPEQKKKLALDWFTWAYRMRNTYMIDWATFRAANGNPEANRSFSKDFNEPSWYYRTTKDNPWRNKKPIEVAELDKYMQEMLQKWGKAPTVKKEIYSDQYVLVNTEAKGKVHANPSFTGKITHILASLKGEPLKFDIEVRESLHIKRQPGKYWLESLDNKLIKYAELPEGITHVELKVPGPGLYKFSCKRGGAGWNIKIPESLPSALIFSRDKDVRTNYAKRYFYVPKESKKIVLYVQSGSIDIKDPDGKRQLKCSVNGNFVEIDVPENFAGKVWSIAGKLRNAWFLNMPTILSNNPSTIILPEELAKKDGLTIVK